MLLANYGRSTVGMLAGLGGTAEVTKLQQSLVNLAQATGHPEFMPGRTDGQLDDATMVAIAAALSIASNELPGYISTALNLAMIGGAGTTTVKNYVSQYATQLAVAFNAAAVKYRKAPPAPAPTTPIVVSAPWYTTWWGIGGLIIGGVVVYKFLFASKPAQ